MLTTVQCDDIINRLMALVKLDGRNLVEFRVVNRGFVQFTCIFNTGEGIFISDSREANRAALQYRVVKPPYGYDVVSKFQGTGSTSYLRLYDVISQAIEEAQCSKTGS